MSFDAELKLIQAVERVRALHKPTNQTQLTAHGYKPLCEYCWEFNTDEAIYPCPTIQALDGEQE